MISAKRRKNTVRESKIEMDNETWFGRAFRSRLRHNETWKDDGVDGDQGVNGDQGVVGDDGDDGDGDGDLLPAVRGKVKDKDSEKGQ